MQHLFIHDTEENSNKIFKISSSDINKAATEIEGSFIWEGDIPEDAFNFSWDSVNSEVILESSIDKQEIATARYTEIDNLNSKENKKDFLFGGEFYVADKESIQAVQNQCLTMEDEDSIPTPYGVWVLSNDETRSFTVEEFKVFSTAFFMRGSNNFGIKTLHKNSIAQIVADMDQTIQDIKDYDISNGWI